MVLSMAYLLQRRFGWFHRTATNQFWLDVHLMTGTVGAKSPTTGRHGILVPLIGLPIRRTDTSWPSGPGGPGR